MVTRHAKRAVVVAACALTALGACESTLVPARSLEPMLYLILSPDSLEGLQSDVRALLALTGTPEQVEYLTADRFTMRRASDGALFDWREDPSHPTSYIPFGGNYVLAESASTRGLGRRDLRAGETYLLDVLVNGRAVTGSATIPARASPAVMQRPDGSRIVVWPRIAAAGWYQVEAETDIGETRTTTDTFYVLKEDIPVQYLPAQPHFRLTAMDTNWVHYLRDSSVVRAGVQGAYGLLGAKSAVTIAIPPR